MATHSFQIDSKYTGITILIEKLHDLFLGIGLDERDLSELEICLVEALNNVVKHSYNAQPGYIINLEIDIDMESITVKIIDFGITRTNFSKPTLDYNPDDIDNLPESGIGLFIIDRLMDSTKYETEGDKNIFILTKTFRK